MERSTAHSSSVLDVALQRGTIDEFTRQIRSWPSRDAGQGARPEDAGDAWTVDLSRNLDLADESGNGRAVV